MAADLAIVNGVVLGAPRATAVAVEGGRIVAVGGAEVADGAAETVDARGGLVMPGFDDGHIHLRSGARESNGALLYPLETVAEVQAAIRRHADANPDEPWVLGRGWLYAAFPGAMPTAAQLDEVIPDRPAWMGCFDGHTGWANTLAMRLAGVDRDTPDPPAGVIVRDAEGNADRRVQGGRPDADRRRRPAADRGRGPGLGPARDRGPPRGRDHRRAGRAGSTPTSSPSGAASTMPASWPSGSAAR